MARSKAATGAPGSALDEYATKRSFTATPEPAPHAVPDRTGPLLFVIQQHAARNMHYDLRLELDGVLKSWAVPKGPVLQPGDAPHLAVPTEDHPLAYGSFEGVIPQGQYGAGGMIVWDCGIYSPDEGGVLSFHDRAQAEQRVRDELAAGKVSLCLLGEKVKGSYALVRTKDKSWLLLKHRDPRPMRGTWSEDLGRSVLSPYAVANAANVRATDRLTYDALAPAGPPEAMPAKLAPMLAGLGEAAFTHKDWLYEPKLDGYRILAFVGPDGVKLRTRNNIDVTAAFPRLVDDLKMQPALPLVLDGEIVVLRDGRPSFDALQERVQLRAPRDIDAADRTTPSVFFVFDLLHVLGLNVRGARYVDRRRYLGQCLVPTPRVQFVHAEPDGTALYRAAVQAGFEGMMAKRRASTYQPGKRSDDWLKVKHVRSTEFVVGGYTEGNGARRDQFGALLLGVWDDGKLQPVGNVGSGFDDRTLAAISAQLAERRVTKMPFDTRPESNKPGSQTKMIWTRPDLVAEVQFFGWTDAGNLRAPVFVRLRNDVDPASITRARAQERTAAPTPATDGGAAPSGAPEAILQQLAAPGADLTLAVGANRIKLTNLDKVLWPARHGHHAYTKRDLLQYLARVAPFMLRHLCDRPLTVIRMPDGIDGEMFFQKHFDAAAVPPYVRTIELVDEEGGARQYVLCNNIETLLWLGQMGTLEFHAPHASVPAGAPPRIDENDVFDRPDYVVFDLDPYIYSGKEAKGAEPEFNSKAFAKAREVAFHLREILGAMSLQAFVKTTGKTGLHIFVPIERTISADQARDVCRLVGQHLLRRHPNDITMEWQVEKRTGKIFFDHNMNGRGRTLNAAYSPRRIPGAWVATPVSWDELAKIEPAAFSLSTVPDRLGDNGDPWQGILQARHDLTRVFAREG